MAGNIIPAIATTNAVIAGLIVLEGLKILSGELESCRTVSLAAAADPVLDKLFQAVRSWKFIHKYFTKYLIFTVGLKV